MTQPNVPDTNVGDSISRQMAIETTKRIPDLTVYAFCSFIDMLNNLPPAPERKRGEWIRLNEFPNDASLKCSECGVVLEDWVMGVFYNYCPICGADMRPKKEEKK